MNHFVKSSSGAHALKTRKACVACVLGALILALAVEATASELAAESQSDIKATAVASPKTIGVAEPLLVSIEVFSPEGVTVRFPEAGEKVGEFEVVSHRDTLDIPTVDGRKNIRQLTLESLQAGALTLPEFEVYFADRRGEEAEFATVNTNAIPIVVESSITDLDDPTDFRDLKNVVFLDEPVNAKPIAWGVWAMIGALGMTGFVGFVLVGKFLRRLSPKQRALRALDQLSDSESLSRCDSKLVYEETTRVLRTFIESQFEFPATRQTTEEFLQAVGSDSRLEDALQDRLGRFLDSADLVKFAGLSCSKEVLCNAIEMARQFVLDAKEQRNAAEKPDRTDAGCASNPVPARGDQLNVFDFICLVFVTSLGSAADRIQAISRQTDCHYF